MKGADFLDCADRLANGTFESDLRTAVSRAYYGAFHEVLSLLREQGIRLPKTEQVHIKSMYCLQDCGDLVAQDVAELLEYLRSQRRLADYELNSTQFNQPNTARSEIAQARRIVDLSGRCRKSTDFRSKVRAQAKLLGLPVSD
jgi:uncharacterized protein (UPF0332 family)